MEALGTEGVEPEVELPEGALEAEGSESEVAPEPEEQYDFLNLDEIGDKHVTLKIEGEDVPLKLSEVLSGYNAQAVSTKRFQEAAKMQQEAEWGLRLQQAIDDNPEMALQIIAQQKGLTPLQFAKQQAAEAEAEEDEYADPLERMIVQERKAREQLEERLAARDADEQLGRAISGLQKEYGVDDAMTREVVRAALNMGVGPDQFPMIYQALAFQKMQAGQQAGQEFAAGRASEEEKRNAAKAAAASVVSSGTGAANTTTRPPDAGNMSLREAFESAWDQVQGR